MNDPKGFDSTDLDSRLARMFAVPEDAGARAVAAILRSSESHDQGTTLFSLAHWRRALAPLLAAALLLASAAAGFLSWDADQRDARLSGTDLALLYSRWEHDPAAVSGTCSTGRALESWFAERYRARLEVDVDPALVPIHGPFEYEPWPTATLLVGSQDDRGVVVLVDLLSRDPRPLPPTDPTLQVHRRTIGPFVLYEISRLAEPRCLPRFQ